MLAFIVEQKVFFASVPIFDVTIGFTRVCEEVNKDILEKKTNPSCSRNFTI